MEDSPTALLDRWLSRAVAEGASDLHAEPEASSGKLHLRLRRDGKLASIGEIPAGLAPPVLAEIKERAGIDLARRRQPLDGRFVLANGSETIPVRVSIVPSVRGEAVVLRLLSRENHYALSDLGMEGPLRLRLQKMMTERDGLFLVAGPTGAGKTTTLYALLHEIDCAARKVIAVEDPVEILRPDIVQVNVRRETGLTFATALRAALRQSPDLLLVGEIRDPETAAIAVTAALTGHLVLATVHASSPAEVVPRLTDLGIPAADLTACLRGCLAQRLVRKLCSTCRTTRPADAYARTHLDLAELPSAVGCEDCRGTGFQGRQGLFALAEGDDLAACGPESLREAGYDLVRAGLTTLEEVLAVTG